MHRRPVACYFQPGKKTVLDGPCVFDLDLEDLLLEAAMSLKMPRPRSSRNGHKNVPFHAKNVSGTYIVASDLQPQSVHSKL